VRPPVSTPSQPQAVQATNIMTETVEVASERSSQAVQVFRQITPSSPSASTSCSITPRL
jgi:hypothetical protein